MEFIIKLLQHLLKNAKSNLNIDDFNVDVNLIPTIEKAIFTNNHKMIVVFNLKEKSK